MKRSVDYVGYGRSLQIFTSGDLTAMMNDPEMVTGGKVDKALVNAQAFTEAVYERLK